MSLFHRMNFLQSKFFLAALNFWKGDTNNLFKKRQIFPVKNKVFVQIIPIFFLKI